MKRILPILVCAVLISPVLDAARARQTATGEAVIEKYLTAVGGREALGKLTSRRMTGTIAAQQAQTPAELKGTYEASTKAPNKVRVLLKLDLTPLGMAETLTIEQKFDGTNAVTMDSMQGPRQITGSQLEHMKNNIFPSPVLHYKTNGMKFEMLPKEQVGGRDATGVLVTPKSGPPFKLYFDNETSLIVRSVVRITTPEQGEIEQISELSDYRSVDGMKVPFKIVNTSPGQKITITIEKVEHNVPLDDALFVVKGL